MKTTPGNCQSNRQQISNNLDMIIKNNTQTWEITANSQLQSFWNLNIVIITCLFVIIIVIIIFFFDFPKSKRQHNINPPKFSINIQEPLQNSKRIPKRPQTPKNRLRISQQPWEIPRNISRKEIWKWFHSFFWYLN